ncbi:MAG: hypothetical protein Q9P01_04990 [Anaerolineae bacterium]|nr:hypothetical protein [Anaerolineae bacterium]
MGEIVQQFTDEGASSLLELQDFLSWSPEGNILAALLTDLGGRGSMVFWDVESEERIFRSRSSTIAWHPTENYIALNVVPDDAGQGAYKDIFVREIGGDVVATLTGHQGEVFVLEWSPDGTMLASFSDDGTIRIWERQSDDSDE